MNLYLRIVRYIKPYWGKLLLALICLVGASGTQLYIPWVVRDVIDKVLNEKDVLMLQQIVFLIIVIFICRGFFVYGQQYLMSYVSERAMISVRMDFFRKMQQFALSYYEKRTTGAIMSHYTNDIGGLQAAMLTSGVEFVTESFVLIVSIVSMFALNWKLSILTFIAAPLIAIAVNLLGKKIRSIGGQVQERAAEMNSLLQQTIAGVRVVKSFAREDFEEVRFEEQNERNFKTGMKAVRVSALLTPIVEFFAVIGVAAVFWYGGMAVINKEMTAGALVAFLIFAVNLSNPLKRISRTYATLQRSLASADRVFAVMDMVPEIQDKPAAKELAHIDGEVAFDRISFEYEEGRPVLRNIEFTAKPGQTVALVGPSGSGKTTFVNLLPRFYEATEGTIRIDGTDIRDVTQQSLREQIGIVPQETLLFVGTVRENIRYGRLDATEEEIRAAAKAARADEFIEKLPKGYDSEIGERGVLLSGGQRQRMAIARAILKDPRILILDEATSALDTESEKLVQEALDALMKDRTSFVIAHRLSTIFQADVILVVESGNIVEQGTHKDLLAKGGVYAKLYYTQFGEEGQEEGEEVAPINI
jgi:ABC-type multidrug transport system, ATPase and permease components